MRRHRLTGKSDYSTLEEPLNLWLFRVRICRVTVSLAYIEYTNYTGQSKDNRALSI